MKLYYSPGACSLADHIVLDWIGAPYEAVRVSREERAAPAFRALNPAGAVPVLEDGGWVLTQNAAILNYLADAFPAAKLGGDGTPKSRAEVNRWLAFVNSDVHPTFKALFGGVDFLNDAAAVDALKQRAKTNLRTLYERVDAQLAGREWLTGTRSIADPYLYVTLRWARQLGVDLGGLDNLAAFMRRIEADANVGKVLAVQGLSPAA